VNEGNGNLNIYNPDKQISEQVTLKTIVSHDCAMKLARTGIPEVLMDKPLTDNERTTLRFKGLKEVISAQQCIISNVARPVIKINCETKWEKTYKEEEEREKNPFNEENNDYNELISILSFLDECEQDLIEAKRTKKFDDDFIWEKTDYAGENILELTPNFFKMMKGLEESFEEIYGLLLKHKIVSSGIVEDPDISDKQKEEEMMRRIINA